VKIGYMMCWWNCNVMYKQRRILLNLASSASAQGDCTPSNVLPCVQQIPPNLPARMGPIIQLGAMPFPLLSEELDALRAEVDL
jgi:hypothetical protein